MAEGRGGRRVGTAGKSYTNRGDLNRNKAPKVAPAATNAQYGAQAAQLRSLQALPLAPKTAPASTASGTGSPNGSGATPPQSIADMLAGVEMGPPPTALNAPTERPNEPLTAGVNIGAGLGAAPTAPMANPQLPRDLIVSLEMIATLPDASDATRNMVRQLRSRL